MLYEVITRPVRPGVQGARADVRRAADRTVDPARLLERLGLARDAAGAAGRAARGEGRGHRHGRFREGGHRRNNFV